MRTTLDIDAKLLADAIAACGAPNKSAAVRLGLEASVILADTSVWAEHFRGDRRDPVRPPHSAWNEWPWASPDQAFSNAAGTTAMPSSRR